MKAIKITILLLTAILFFTLTGAVIINVHREQKKEYYYFEDPAICATCHNELNPYGVWVKATEHEYTKADFLKIPRRPVMTVSKDVRKLVMNQ